VNNLHIFAIEKKVQKRRKRKRMSYPVLCLDPPHHQKTKNEKFVSGVLDLKL
jgi:hypothetical protein